jgi:hypothetical protein
MRVFFFLIPMALLFACGEGQTKKAEKSEAIKEAMAIHEEAMAVYRATADLIHDLMHEHEIALEKSQEASQDALEALVRRGELLDQLHDEMHDWEHNLAEIPGHEHSHDHDHGHEHNHDHAKDRILEGLSDEEHLAIQKEQLALIQKIKASIEAIPYN